MSQVFNYLAGSLARIYTTVQEVDDPLIFWGFISGFILNAVLAAQMVYYWNSPKSRDTTSTKTSTEQVKKAMEVPSSSTSGVQTKQKSPSTRRRG